MSRTMLGKEPACTVFFRARSLSAVVGIIVASICAGCGTAGDTSHELRHVNLHNVRTGEAVDRAVALSFVQSTPLHIYDDPCETPFKTFEFLQVKFLGKGRQSIILPSYNSGYTVLPFLIKHEHAAFMVFAPGYNIDFSRMRSPPALHETAAAQADMSSVPHAEEWTDDEVEYQVEVIAQSLRARRGLTKEITNGFNEKLKPLDSGADKSILLFVLRHGNLWKEIRSHYDWGKDKEAIAVICETVVLIDQKLSEQGNRPAFNKDQEKIIAWCKEIVEVNAVVNGEADGHERVDN